MSTARQKRGQEALMMSICAEKIPGTGEASSAALIIALAVGVVQAISANMSSLAHIPLLQFLITLQSSLYLSAILLRLPQPTRDAALL